MEADPTENNENDTLLRESDDADTGVETIKRRTRRRKRKTQGDRTLADSTHPVEDSLRTQDITEAKVPDEVLKGQPSDVQTSKQETEEPAEQEDLTRYFTVNIRRSDPIKIPGKGIFKPYVLACIIDKHTGKVVSPSSGSPKSTKPFNLRMQQTIIPEWKEDVQFADPIDKVINSSTILFFEIYDAATRERKGRGGHIAWAFLQMVGENRRGLDGKARLQLFQYQVTMLSQPNVSLAWENWKLRHKRLKNCSLYIFASQQLRIGSLERKKEERKKTDDGVTKFPVSGSEPKGEDAPKDAPEQEPVEEEEEEVIEIPWRRMNGEKCIIPNNILFRADTAKYGAFTVSFSSSGFYTAVACIADNSYPIKIFDVVSGSRIVTLDGHSDLVYELVWSEDERYLISASSDGSVRVWDIFMDRINKPKLRYILQHSSFVYTAQLYPLDFDGLRFIITGCFDSQMRAWMIDDQEFASAKTVVRANKSYSGHQTAVTTVRFSTDGQKLFTGDMSGSIHLWTCSILLDDDSGLPLIDVTYTTSVRVDTEASPCTSIRIHPNEKRLLIQNKNNQLRIFDIRLLKFTNTRKLSTPNIPAVAGSFGTSKVNMYPRAIFSPCGSLVLAATEDSITILYSDSLKDINTYASIYPGKLPIMSVSFHPYDHIFCCAAIGDEAPVMIYTYDESMPELKYSLKSTKAEDNKKEIKEKEKQVDHKAETALRQIQDFINKSAFLSPAVQSPRGSTARLRSGRDANIDGK